MELFTAIALLCQINNSDMFVSVSKIYHVQCQQSYLHCVNLKSIKMTKEEALNQCILEKK